MAIIRSDGGYRRDKGVTNDNVRAMAIGEIRVANVRDDV